MCSESRPFILENTGFQRQLIELEAMRGVKAPPRKKQRSVTFIAGTGTSSASAELAEQHATDAEQPTQLVELLVPGLRTFNVQVPLPCSIDTVKQTLVERVNSHFASSTEASTEASERRVGASWLVFQVAAPQ